MKQIIWFEITERFWKKGNKSVVYLRLNTKDKVLQEPSNRDDRKILLGVKHVKFVKIAMEPRGAWLPVSINKSEEGCEHSKNGVNSTMEI